MRKKEDTSSAHERMILLRRIADAPDSLLDVTVLYYNDQGTVTLEIPGKIWYDSPKDTFYITIYENGQEVLRNAPVWANGELCNWNITTWRYND